MGYLILTLTILGSFLCGSIPFGYICVKIACGIDIRKEGSGNIGSTNVRRVAGKKISILVQVLDIVKGIFPVLAAICIANFAASLTVPVSKDLYLSLTAVAAILGHDYTPFLKFNGGKGVNTTLGAFVLIAPVPVFSGVAAYTLLKVLTPIVSIRSLVLGLVIPAVCILTNKPLPITLAAVFASALLIYRHKSNISRLLKGQEK
jgi:glycerol-3-phosphate acyltransferase PlsY